MYTERRGGGRGLGAGWRRRVRSLEVEGIAQLIIEPEESILWIELRRTIPRNFIIDLYCRRTYKDGHIILLSNGSKSALSYLSYIEGTHAHMREHCYHSAIPHRLEPCGRSRNSDFWHHRGNYSRQESRKKHAQRRSLRSQ